MSKIDIVKPDYIFETSWEVCNKVGGIYTVISTKAPQLVNEFGDNYILIGPDVWKETRKHPDFIEDNTLYNAWLAKARQKGINLRAGRWNIPGKPVVVLVDFTPYFPQKDEVFAWLWEKFKVDSLTGQWDYIEPALFGYASARVIESFYEFYLSDKDKIVAQFHEWMTGSGILYLKDNVPQVGTIFTTHATILGRSIAGNGMQLYGRIEQFDPKLISKNFGITSKYSLEKISAKEADCFTTVSAITSIECKHFLKKKPDVITANGFDNSFVPLEKDFKKKRSEARERLFEVAEALLNQKLSRKSLLLVNSGRYEFKNKGIDLYIDALGELNRKHKTGPEIVALITVPGHHSGASKELQGRMQENGIKEPLSRVYTTHNLYDPANDPVLNRIKQNQLDNSIDEKVKIIFVPAYLDGNDGIFNMLYYDLLIGFDLSAFPSYYEPWGYTPLESSAFSIPTITTTLAGFGKWVKNNYKMDQKGVKVIERDDNNDAEVVREMTGFILWFNNLTSEEKALIRQEAYDVSRIALWENLLINYYNAYSVALGKVARRPDLYYGKSPSKAYFLKDISKDQKPVWKKVYVKPIYKGNMLKLLELARNLWWSWNYEAKDLFESIDAKAWEDLGHNPIALIESLSVKQIDALEKDNKFISRLDEVYSLFKEYISAEKPKHSVAYFSMEYGLHGTLKTYSGGLGILAGDYLKEASDSNKNIIGVGLLYRYGYFRQEISINGDQIALYSPQKFTYLPLSPVRDEDGEWLRISLALPGRNIYAKVWRVDIGRIPLYLLDTDNSDNQPNDRTVTHQLYGGDWENRFKQELLLGVGGIRMLKALGVDTDIYHLNEGHAAFAGLERLRYLVQEEGLSFDEAYEVVRSSSLFTTHTPVPAGHDVFDEDMLRTYIPHYPDRLNISWERFINFGRSVENGMSEKFSMSILAARLSQEVNGVSKIHGRVSCKMFSHLYEGYFPEELHIGYVTNGVHLPTWSGKGWQVLFRKYFDPQFTHDQSNQAIWEKIGDVPSKEIWDLKSKYRRELVHFARKKLEVDLTSRQENPKYIMSLIDSLNEEALTIGFARRFATYKRADLIFTNLERLSRIVNNEEKPVQFIFAGKAHPADKAGQELIHSLIKISHKKEFIGKIVFLENYDMTIAKRLLQGVDVWLNTPTRPLEASGTSGEKALMNGVLNLSVLDGWWAEGYKPGGGWAISEARTYANQEFQNELDAETIFSLIEEEIVPAFYERKEGIPEKWITYMRNSFKDIAPHYTMKRMLDDYERQYYLPLFRQSHEIRKDNFKLAHEKHQWKMNMMARWESIRVIRLAVPDSTVKPLELGDDFIAEIDLKLHDLSADDVGLEILFGHKEEGEITRIKETYELEFTGSKDDIATYRCNIPFSKVGVYDYAFRMYPKSRLLAHRQDINLVRWI